MDLHDDDMDAARGDVSRRSSQTFLFEFREKWSPGGPPPGIHENGDYA